MLIMGGMSRQILTVVTDDLDGSPDAVGVTFAIDGLTYTIDLAPSNEKALRDALAPYIKAGRRAPNGHAAPRKRGPSNSMEVRAWAESQGIAVPPRGRIPTTVQEAYDNR